MRPILEAAAALAALAFLPAAAVPQSMPAKGAITGPYAFPEQGGAAIYKGVCQGCHMADGLGATGAATYPALAKNPKLATPGYPILMVLNGHGAMPTFRSALDDVQIADVVTYIRGNFGNAYAAKVTPAQVKALRGG
jgi:mono/diheme cytochrome c family protein